MLPNNKIFIVWCLDGLGLCMDVIRFEVMSWLVDWKSILEKQFGREWRSERLSGCFSWCCYYGHLDVVKWLLRVYSKEQTIDIHAENEEAFRISCGSGHLDVVKQLWKVSDGKINIHANNDYAFKWSCYNDYLDVVKWLWETSNGGIDMSVIDSISENDHKECMANYLKSIR